MNATQLYLSPLKKISPEKIFFLSVMIVNGGNYLYNLLIGRYLGPEAFADAALLITFLLLLSFIGMAFQIVTTKYTALLSEPDYNAFLEWIMKRGLVFGIALGCVIIAFSTQLQELFNTKSPLMFSVFGAGLPLYFLMSINRGVYQGQGKLKKLSATYQTEMISRLLFTFSLLLVPATINSSVAVAVGILLSLVFGMLPFHGKIVRIGNSLRLEEHVVKQVKLFFAITCFYEFTQIIINNSDILLVKHYFDNNQAGLYASLALIGRVVYFVAWMFVMLLMRKVIRLKKEGVDTRPLLMKNVLYISILSVAIVSGAWLFPKLAVTMMFGKEYLSIAPLLWRYALATSVFAIANIFAYYFLSIGRYLPVFISGLMGTLQIGLIILYHDSLAQVVHVQIIAMVLLLLSQLSFFFYQSKTNIHRN